MNEVDVIRRITELCEARSWTYYRLAKASGIPYSTLSTMLHKTNVPSVPSLAKICNGFGITLSQFFNAGDETVKLTLEERQCLKLWNTLDSKSKDLACVYMQGLADRQETGPTKK